MIKKQDFGKDIIQNGELYDLNGELYDEGKYTNDKKTGEWKIYDTNGTLSKTKNYKEN